MEKALLRHFQDALKDKFIDILINDGTQLLTVDLSDVLTYLFETYSKVLSDIVTEKVTSICAMNFYPSDSILIITALIKKAETTRKRCENFKDRRTAGGHRTVYNLEYKRFRRRSKNMLPKIWRWLQLVKFKKIFQEITTRNETCLRAYYVTGRVSSRKYIGRESTQRYPLTWHRHFGNGTIYCWANIAVQQGCEDYSNGFTHSHFNYFYHQNTKFHRHTECRTFRNVENSTENCQDMKDSRKLGGDNGGGGKNGGSKKWGRKTPDNVSLHRQNIGH